MGTRDDRFWAEFLGVASADWSTPGASIRPHGGLAGYRGFWCFRRNARTVVSAPEAWVMRLRSLLGGWSPERLLDPGALAQVLGEDFEGSLGPSFQGCLDPTEFADRSDRNARWVDSGDEKAVDAFRSACCAADWEASGLDRSEPQRAAYVENGTITALAGYRPWRRDVGDPCVLTHPEFRGRGRGAAVASLVVARALGGGKLLLFQTLESNRAAVRVAFALGYQRYATHVAVRLKREAP